MLSQMIARFSLRLATAADFAAVDALLARSYPRLLAQDYPASVRILAIPLISRGRPELLTSGSYWLALDPQGGVLGAGGWTHGAPDAPEDGDRPATGHIRHFAPIRTV
jgi:hypothetical protein